MEFFCNNCNKVVKELGENARGYACPRCGEVLFENKEELGELLLEEKFGICFDEKFKINRRRRQL